MKILNWRKYVILDIEIENRTSTFYKQKNPQAFPIEIVYKPVDSVDNFFFKLKDFLRFLQHRQLPL